MKLGFIGVVVLVLISITLANRLIASRKLAALAEAHEAANRELQAFLIKCVDELDAVLQGDETDIGVLRAKTDQIIEKMESRNSNGELDEFILDNKAGIDEAIANRSAA